MENALRQEDRRQKTCRRCTWTIHGHQSNIHAILSPILSPVLSSLYAIKDSDMPRTCRRRVTARGEHTPLVSSDTLRCASAAMLSLAPCTFSTALALALIALTRVAVVAAFDMSRNDNVRPSLFAVRCLSSFCADAAADADAADNMMSVHFSRSRCNHTTTPPPHTRTHPRTTLPKKKPARPLLGPKLIRRHALRRRQLPKTARVLLRRGCGERDGHVPARVPHDLLWRGRPPVVGPFECESESRVGFCVTNERPLLILTDTDAPMGP